MTKSSAQSRLIKAFFNLLEDVYKCAECGYVVSGGGTIPALDHDYKVTTASSAKSEHSSRKLLTGLRICSNNKRKI